MEIRIERDEGIALGMTQIQGLPDDGWIVAFVREFLLLRLERRRELELGADAEEQWMRVSGKTVGEVTPERGDVEPRAHDDCGHPRAAVRPRDADAIDDRVEHAWTRTKHLGDLGRRYVLTLPAERVADAIDEVEIAFGVPSHEIARPEPGVIRLEHVAEDLLLGGVDTRVTFEPRAHVHAIRQDLSDRFADLVRIATTTESPLVADRLAAGVEPYECGRGSVRQKRGAAANGGGLTVDVEERDVALRRRVELQDSRNAEPILQLGPDVRPEPVAAG